MTPNELLAYALLAGIAGLAGWALWRSSRPAATAEVRATERDGDRLTAQVALTNTSRGTWALEEAEVTKGPGTVVGIDDDLRLPVGPEDTITGEVTLQLSGEAGPVKLRVLWVLRSPTGAELAESWIKA